MRSLVLSLAALTVLQTTWIPVVEVSALPPNRIPEAIASRHYDTAQDAIRNLAFDDPVLEGAPEQATALARLVEHVASGTGDPVALAEQLASVDGSEAEVAAGILVRLLMNQGRYAEASAVAGGGAILDVLAALPAESYEALPGPVSTRLQPMITGSPVVDIRAGEEIAEFVLDTGAGYSLVRASDVERFGVKIPEGPEIPLGTATDISITARFGWLPELRVGSVRIRNHHVLVVSDEMLDIDIPDGPSYSVRGIVGWNAIRNLRVVLDFPGRTAELRLPVEDTAVERNFFWLDYPLVRLTDERGRRLLFGLDTGSRVTTIEANLLTKPIDVGEVRRGSATIGSAGGAQTIETDIAERLSLTITGHRFDFIDVRREQQEDAYFVIMDGVLGADLAQRCVMTIDYPNRHFGLRALGADDWRVEAAARLPESGEVYLGLFNDGERDGFMRLGWERQDDRLEIYDRSMLPSAEVYEAMTAEVSARDLAPRGTEIAFYQGATVFELEYRLTADQVTGQRRMSGPAAEARSSDLELPLPPGTLLRAVSFLLPLVLPAEAGTTVSYPWFAPLGGSVEEVTISARDGGRIETPAGVFETTRYELRGGSPENDIYVAREDPPRIVRIDVLGQPLRFLTVE